MTNYLFWALLFGLLGIVLLVRYWLDSRPRPPTRYAEVRFVHPDGNDEWPGTADQPKATVAGAIDSLPAHNDGGTTRHNGTVMVGPGIYDVDIAALHSGIRLVGEGGPGGLTPTIRCVTMHSDD